jgi:hypothetical protein
VQHRTANSISVIALSVTVACGGAQARDASSAASKSAGESAGERCLAAADARRGVSGAEPAKISVKHVLVRYAGAKHAPDSIKRTREEACLRAEEALTKLKEGSSFAEVVSLYSDELGAETREGSLGEIRPADVEPTFADAAFELKEREVSEVVETRFGFHVILRVE